MKVLVVSIPQAGHLNPMLPLVSAFVETGDEVVVATGDALREQIEKTGAGFHRAGNGLDAWFSQLASRVRGAPGDGLPPSRIGHYFGPRLFGEIGAADMIDDVVAAGEQLRPDLVMFDFEAVTGPLAARLVGARQANHQVGPLPPPDVLQLMTDALSPMWRSFGHDVPPYAGLYEDTTIAICPPSMELETVPRGERLLLRPAPLPVRPLRPQSPPLVYFTLGTLWANPTVVATVLEALADLPVRVVATLGSLDPGELRSVPSNAELHRFVPQDELLPDASVVVHHAGAGTMFGALAHGLPQVALPQAADNFINAAALADRGAGVTLLPDQMTCEAVTTAVSRALDDEAISTAARAVAEEIAGMPAPAQVAERLRN